MTTAESPAQLLRRAATHLRQLATAATPPPWTAVPRYRKSTQGLAQYDIQKPPRPGSNIPQEKHVHPAKAADALYGVAMHPGVGLALADWIDEQAAFDEYLVQSGLPTPDPKRALAVARQILGEVTR